MLAGPAIRVESDQRLVQLAREGYERAFEELVRRYRLDVVRFAARIVGPDRAEDVVQESLARAHASITSGGSEIQFRPWL